MPGRLSAQFRPPNTKSVATLIEIGPVSILLGADLENCDTQTEDRHTGYKVYSFDEGRP